MEPRCDSRKLGYEKSTERPSQARLQSLERAGEVGCGGTPGTGLGCGAEGTLGTELQVQHFQEELNIKLLRQLFWKSPPSLPAQLWELDLCGGLR